MNPLIFDLGGGLHGFDTTSPVYQLLGKVYHKTQAFTFAALLNDPTFLVEPNERGSVALHERPLLLQYLGHVTEFSQQFSLNGPITASSLQLENEQHDDTFTVHRDNIAYHPKWVRIVAQQMLERGADPWLADDEGRTAADQLFAMEWTPLLRTVLDAPNTPPVDALQTRACLTTLRVNRGNSLGHALPLPWLHAAVAKDNLPLIDLLLERGFSLEHLDAHGRTPLFYAGFAQTAAHLLARGANPLHHDVHQESVGAVWASMGRYVAEKAGLQHVLGQALKNVQTSTADAKGADAVHDANASTLFNSAVSDTKADFVKLLRSFKTSHGFKVDDTLDVAKIRDYAGITGTEQAPKHLSLIARTALNILEQPQRAPTVLTYLAEHSSNLWHESVPGVADVWWVALAAHRSQRGGERLMEILETTFEARFACNEAPLIAQFSNWLDDSKRTMDRMLSAPATTWIGGWVDQHHLQSSLASGFAQLLSARTHDVFNRHHLELEQQTPTEQVRRQAWVEALNKRDDEHGVKASAWMDSLVDHYFHGATRGQSYHQDSLLSDLYGTKTKNGVVPLDSQAFNVLLGTAAIKNLSGTQDQAWGNQGQHPLIARYLAEGGIVDTSLPKFEQRLDSLRTYQPGLARTVETHILETTVGPQTLDHHHRARL